MNEARAELYGALLGDGCLCKHFSKRDIAYRYIVQYTGHIRETHYYTEIIRPLYEREFGLSGYIYQRKKYNATIYTILNRKVFDYFRSEGFPQGKKNNISIPESILTHNEFSIACVRGIFDTDGSIYRRYSKQYEGHTRVYDYKVIQIKMNSEEVIHQIKAILYRNGILSNSIIKDKKCSVLRITKQAEIAKFFNMISPRNQHHIERYLKNS